MNSLSVRQRLPELMDQPGLDPGEHVRALAGLQRINTVSRSSALLAKPILRLAKRLGQDSLSVCDVACGGGDVGIGLQKIGRKQGVHLSLTGVDFSDIAITQAKQNAKNADVEMDFLQQDILKNQLPTSYDVVVSSLFMHHLDPPEVVDVLGKMASAANHLVIINDLCRSTVGWLTAHVVCRLLSRSYVVHVDGPRSVRGAYTDDEFMDLCQQAGLVNVSLRRRWPFRFLMTGQPNE